VSDSYEMDYPLTLPSVSPDTSHLLNERKRTTTGIVTIIEAAPYRPHSDPIFDSNDFNPNGRVHIRVS
jgi:hypothetical protein